MTEDDILDLIKNDEWMMAVLKTARDLNLPDWMIGAGFVRSKVWDYLHDCSKKTPIGDIDLIYFEPANIKEAQEKKFEQELKQVMDENWSVKNQARMHLVDGDLPRNSSEEGLALWVETPTCVAVRLNQEGELEFIAPHGIDDLVNLVVRPSPKFSEARNIEIYRERMKKKKWQEKWPKLTILDS